MASGRNAEYDTFRGKMGDITNAVVGHGLPVITAIANALFERRLMTKNDHQAVIFLHDPPIKVLTTMLNSLLIRIKYNPSTYSEVLEVFRNNELEYIADMLEATRLPAASPTLASSTLASPTLPSPVVNPDLDVSFDNVIYVLKKYKFNLRSWVKLATGLRLGSTADQIEKDHKGSDAQLNALINHWVATDINKSWEKLVEAMEMSDHAIAADQLAHDVGVRGVQSSARAGDASTSKSSGGTADSSHSNTDVSIDNVIYMLKKYKFDPHSWEKLAMGLRLATSIEQIEMRHGDPNTKLIALIKQWVTRGANVSWECLVEAVEMSDHDVQADKLARDKEVGVRPAKQ